MSLASPQQTQRVVQGVQRLLETFPRPERASRLRQWGVSYRQLQRWRGGAKMRLSTYRRLQRLVREHGDETSYDWWQIRLAKTPRQLLPYRILMLELACAFTSDLWSRHVSDAGMQCVSPAPRMGPVSTVGIPCSRMMELHCIFEISQNQIFVSLRHMQPGRMVIVEELMSGPVNEVFIQKIAKEVRRLYFQQRRKQSIVPVSGVQRQSRDIVASLEAAEATV